MPMKKLCVAALSLLLLIPMSSRAQELAATLKGDVADASGAVIPHANVKIEQTNGNGTIRTVQTDAEGNYTATNLPPGDYVGTATANGFSATAQKVTIFVAQNPGGKCCAAARLGESGGDRGTERSERRYHDQSASRDHLRHAGKRA